MPAFITISDALTEVEISFFDAGILPEPSQTTPTVNTDTKPLLLRNEGDACVVGDIALAARGGFSFSSPVVGIVIERDEVTFANDSGTLINAVRREALGQPEGLFYGLTVTAINPLQVTVSRNGGAAGTPLTVSTAEGVWNTNVIAGVGIRFAAGASVGNQSIVYVLEPTVYPISYRNNGGILEARVSNFGWDPIIADDATVNNLDGLTGVGFVFASSLTAANADGRTSRLELFSGGRYFQLSADETTFSQALDFSPNGGSLVPYLNPYALEADLDIGAGSLPEATFSYVAVGKRNGNQSLPNLSLVAEVETAEDDAINISIESLSGGYTSWDIYRKQDEAPYARIATDWDFTVDPVFVDDGTIPAVGSPPVLGQQIEFSVRFQRTFPTLPESLTRASLISEVTSL